MQVGRWRLLFLHPSAGSGFSYTGLYLNSSYLCCLCLCNLRNSALELKLQNFVNLCNQRPPGGIRMQQIRFAPRLRPRPRWGSSSRSPRAPSRMERWKLPPHTSPPRRLRRFDLGAFGASASTPSVSRSRRLRHLFLCPPTQLIFRSRAPECRALHKRYSTVISIQQLIFQTLPK